MTLQFSHPVAGALYLYDQGLKVFPCVPNGKEPAFNGWQEWAAKATRKRIEEFGKANAMHNWGVECSGFLVIDLDKKNGKNGEASLKNILDKGGHQLPKTLRVRTTSGGRHLYYQAENGKNTVGALGEGIDTRGVGGYVVAPGSRIDDKAYELECQDPIAECPAWVPAALAEIRKAAPIQGQVIEGERNNTLASIAGTMRRRGLGFEAIHAALLAVNDNQLERPLEPEEVELIARSVSKYSPEVAEVAAEFLATPKIKCFNANDIDLEKIPPRDWIMQNRYVGGFISVLVAPGGVGKSTLSLLDAVAVATGKDLTGFEVKSKGGVWIYNTEDPVDEMKRRLMALAIHHKIPRGTLKNVHYSSGRESPLIFVKAGRNGIAVNQVAIDECVEFIKANKIKLFLVDPFVHAHEVSENDNMQIAKVVLCFSQIADRTGCAVGIVHHTRKPGADGTAAGDADQARGASALVNAARIAYTLTAMNKEEAATLSVDQERRGWYMRLDNAKANMQPPAARADWFEKISVTLPNLDDVGTIERVPLTDGSEQRRLEKLEACAADLAVALAGIMDVGEAITVNDAFFQITTNPELYHLFGSVKANEGVKSMCAFLGKSPAYAGKYFTLEFTPKSKAGRSVHEVKCHAYDESLS